MFKNFTINGPGWINIDFLPFSLWFAVRSQQHNFEGDPFEAMTGRLGSDGHLAEFSVVFFSCKVNSEDLFTDPDFPQLLPLSLPLSLSDRPDWRDIRGKWPLASSLGRSKFHRQSHETMPCFRGNYSRLISDIRVQHLHRWEHRTELLCK